MSLPNPSMSFTPFDILPASDLNDIVENIEALAAGTGLNSNVITSSKIDWTTSGGIWWQELGRASNTGQTSISVSSFAAKKFLRVTLRFSPSVSLIPSIRFNGDIGANYSVGYAIDNSATITELSQTSFQFTGTTGATKHYWIFEIYNPATTDKTMLGRGTSHTPASMISNRIGNGIWINASQITTISLAASTGNLGQADLIVLGHD